jgi:hypothetical protein
VQVKRLALLLHSEDADGSLGELDYDCGTRGLSPWQEANRDGSLTLGKKKEGCLHSLLFYLRVRSQTLFISRVSSENVIVNVVLESFGSSFCHVVIEDPGDHF